MPEGIYFNNVSGLKLLLKTLYRIFSIKPKINVLYIYRDFTLFDKLGLKSRIFTQFGLPVGAHGHGIGIIQVACGKIIDSM